MTLTQGFSRTTVQLYRDCLRLAGHIAGRSAKGDNIRRVIHAEFRRNAGVKDEETVTALKAAAVRGLSNYFLHATGGNDPKLKEKMKEFEERQAGLR